MHKNCNNNESDKFLQYSFERLPIYYKKLYKILGISYSKNNNSSIGRSSKDELLISNVYRLPEVLQISIRKALKYHDVNLNSKITYRNELVDLFKKNQESAHNIISEIRVGEALLGYDKAAIEVLARFTKDYETLKETSPALLGYVAEAIRLINQGSNPSEALGIKKFKGRNEDSYGEKNIKSAIIYFSVRRKMASGLSYEDAIAEVSEEKHKGEKTIKDGYKKYKTLNNITSKDFFNKIKVKFNKCGFKYPD